MPLILLLLAACIDTGTADDTYGGQPGGLALVEVVIDHEGTGRICPPAGPWSAWSCAIDHDGEGTEVCLPFPDTAFALVDGCIQIAQGGEYTVDLTPPVGYEYRASWWSLNG